MLLEGMVLSSTPLNDCIMAAYEIGSCLSEKDIAIDKMNTVFLTDGHSAGNW